MFYLALQVLAWIQRRTLQPHFEMQMGTRRTACAAHLADDLAFLDTLTHLHQKSGRMCIAGFQSGTMIDLDQVSVIRRATGGSYDTCCRSIEDRKSTRLNSSH